jgi:AbrB family looped-hinge helix DNA binding protein
MRAATKAASVYFSGKGQVVIPRRLRKEFEIEEGTRAYVEATPEGILINP